MHVIRVQGRHYADAVQVSIENMIQVARWCGGAIRPAADGSQRACIVLPVKRAGDRDTTVNVYSGSWLVKTGRGFKVYTAKQFRNVFKETANAQETYSRVHEFVLHAMLKQDKITYNQGTSEETVAIADQVTRAIVGIFN